VESRVVDKERVTEYLSVDKEKIYDRALKNNISNTKEQWSLLES